MFELFPIAMRSGGPKDWFGQNDDLNRGITNITHYDNLGPPVKKRPNKKLKKTQAVIFSWK